MYIYTVRGKVTGIELEEISFLPHIGIHKGVSSSAILRKKRKKKYKSH